MKNFAAAAIFAASASAFDAMAVPDFIAGFMYGMTGDNHLTEIEACYQGGSQVVTDAQKAVQDFKQGDWFKGIRDAGTAWNEIGAAMTTCQGMDDDIAAIEAWAQIFTEPAQLSETVAKNWLFHGRQIKKDIAKEEADWAAGDYFTAGVDTALALTLAVGPIEPVLMGAEPNMPLDAPILFLGGLMEGLVQENHLTEISTCAVDAEATVVDVEDLVGDVLAGRWFRAAEKTKATVRDFKTSIAACESMGDDLTALESWASIFLSPTTLIATVTKHMLFHRSEIMADVNSVKYDWNAGEYYKAGQATADLLYYAVGPVETPTLSAEEEENFGIMTIPDLAAGFVYGMVGENHLTEMEACYQGSADLWSYLHAALIDLEGFHIIKAMEQLELFVYHFQLDAVPCTEMQDDLAAIAAWAQIFKNPSELISTVTKHYLLHRHAVSNDISTIKLDWANESYFATGRATADLVTVLIGPIE